MYWVQKSDKTFKNKETKQNKTTALGLAPT